MQNDRLDLGTDPIDERNTPLYPYHRVTRKETAGYRGMAHLADYGADSFSVFWDFRVDEQFWRNARVIQDLVCNRRNQDVRVGCLDGTFWTHADTPVGKDSTNSQFPLFNGIHIGSNGDDLTNSYTAIRPAAEVLSGSPGIGMRPLVFFLWKTLPDPAWKFSIRNIFVDKSVGTLALSYSKIAREAVFTVDGEVWESAEGLVSRGLTRALKRKGKYQIVTSDDPGTGSGAIALVMNKRGTKVFDAVVQTEEGGFALWSETKSEPFSMTLPRTKGKNVVAFSALRQSLYLVGKKRRSKVQAVFTTTIGNTNILETALPREARSKVLDVSYSHILDQVLVTRQSKVDGEKLVNLWTVNKFELPTSIATWSAEPKVKYWVSPTIDGELLIAASSDRKHVGLKLSPLTGITEQIRLVDTPILLPPVGGIGGIRWTLPLADGVVVPLDPTRFGDEVMLQEAIVLE